MTNKNKDKTHQKYTPARDSGKKLPEVFSGSCCISLKEADGEPRSNLPIISGKRCWIFQEKVTGDSRRKLQKVSSVSSCRIRVKASADLSWGESWGIFLENSMHLQQLPSWISCRLNENATTFTWNVQQLPPELSISILHGNAAATFEVFSSGEREYLQQFLHRISSRSLNKNSAAFILILQ